MDRILIVDDNADMQFLLTNILKEEGYEIFSAGNGARALSEAKKNKPDLVLLDIRLPGMNGLDVLKKIKELNKEILVIMITAFGDITSAVTAMKNGAYDYVTKPFDNEALILNIKRALKSKHLSAEVKDLHQKLAEKKEVEILGHSSAIKKVIKQVELIAPTDMSVIIDGKSGTGKEIVARLIHKKSLRKAKPFIAVDCGAIPETLIESELFGHEKGSFTSADSRKIGKFELANTGTLLLDEITNLSFDAQANLLRALQERVINRIGGKKVIPVDVRIIATTNKDVIKAIKENKFRDDLYHRLSEFEITLPLLSERKEDIPLLARQFVKEANHKLNKNVTIITAEAMNRLENYDWPGNVREMISVIKRAVLLTETNKITPDKLILKLADHKEEFNISELLTKGETYKSIVRRVELELLTIALEKCGNNKSKAAEMLNMNRKTLHRKLNNLGIS